MRNASLRQTWAMIRVFFNIIVGQALNMKVGGKESKWAGTLLWGFVALCMLPTVWVIYYMLNNMYAAFAEINQLGLMISLTLNVGSLLIFMLSLMAAPAIFYFSKDVEYILPLPVKPTQIIGAKFAVALAFEYLLAVVLVGVMFAALWGHIGAGMLTFNMLITALTLPILPLVYSTVIIMLLMRFVRFIRNPDRYNWIIGLGGLALALVFMTQSQGAFTLDEEQLIATLMGEPLAMNILSYVFFTNEMAARAIGAAAWTAPYRSLEMPPGTLQIVVYQVINLITAVVGLALFFVAAGALYFKGVLGLSESGTSGKKMTSADIRSGAVNQSAFRSYVQKELRLLFRSPVAFMNCVLMVLFMPIIMVISFFPIFTAGSDDPMLEVLQAIDLTDPRTAAISLVAMTVLALVTSGSATITASSISREGRNYFVMKYLPIPYRTQLHAKAASGLLVIGFGLLIIFIPLLILFQPPPLLAVAAILVTMPAAFFFNYLGLFFDLLKPKLDWDNEAEAVKQNINILLMIFGGMGVAAGVGFAGWRWLHTPLTAFAVLFTVGVVLMVLAMHLALDRGKQILLKL